MQARRITLDNPQIAGSVRWRVESASSRRQPRRMLSPIYSTDGVRVRVASEYQAKRRYSSTSPEVAQSYFEEAKPVRVTADVAPVTSSQPVFNVASARLAYAGGGAGNSVDGVRRYFAPRITKKPKVKKSNSVIKLVKHLKLSSDVLNMPLSRLKLRKLKLPNFSLGRYGIYAMATAVFLFGIWVSVDGYLANQEAKKEVLSITTGSGANSTETEVPSEPTATSSGEGREISEIQPSIGQVANYAVGATSARYIRIPSISVTSRVFTVGKTSTGAVDTTSNIHDSGWYNGSARFDENKGAAFIVGHINGRINPGVFYDLKNLKKGDSISVERGDGTLRFFKVVSLKTYAVGKVDMIKAMTPVNPDKFGLNLMTCTGDWDSSTNSYDERLLVRAEEI